MTARYILAADGGFETVMMVLAIAACLIVLAALLLPAMASADAAPAAVAVPAS